MRDLVRFQNRVVLVKIMFIPSCNYILWLFFSAYQALKLEQRAHAAFSFMILFVLWFYIGDCLLFLLSFSCWLCCAMFRIFLFCFLFLFLTFFLGRLIWSFWDDWGSLDFCKLFFLIIFCFYTQLLHGGIYLVLVILFTSLFYNTPVRYAYYKLLELIFNFALHLFALFQGRYKFIRADLWVPELGVFFKRVLTNGFSFYALKKIPQLLEFKTFISIVYNWVCFVQSAVFVAMCFFFGAFGAIFLFFSNYIFRLFLLFLKDKLVRLFLFFSAVCSLYSSNNSAYSIGDDPYKSLNAGVIYKQLAQERPLFFSRYAHNVPNNSSLDEYYILPQPGSSMGSNANIIEQWHKAAFGRSVFHPGLRCRPLSFVEAARDSLPDNASLGVIKMRRNQLYACHLRAKNRRQFFIDRRLAHQQRLVDYQQDLDEQAYAIWLNKFCLKSLVIGGTLLSGTFVLFSIFGYKEGDESSRSSSNSMASLE